MGMKASIQAKARPASQSRKPDNGTLCKFLCVVILMRVSKTWQQYSDFEILGRCQPLRCRHPNDSTHDAPGGRCTAGFQSHLCPLWVIRDRVSGFYLPAHVRFAPKADLVGDRARNLVERSSTRSSNLGAWQPLRQARGQLPRIRPTCVNTALAAC